jgi:hypothetical protein
MQLEQMLQADEGHFVQGEEEDRGAEVFLDFVHVLVFCGTAAVFEVDLEQTVG